MIDQFLLFKTPVYNFEVPKWVKDYLSSEKLPILVQEKDQFTFSRMCEPKSVK